MFAAEGARILPSEEGMVASGQPVESRIRTSCSDVEIVVVVQSNRLTLGAKKLGVSARDVRERPANLL